MTMWERMSGRMKIILVAAGTAALVMVLVLVEMKQKQAQRDQMESGVGDEVVATYAGGQITADELRRYINDFAGAEGRHEVCDKHGTDHSKCPPGEDCETHPLDSVESYRILLKQMVMEKMVNRWISEKGMASRKDVSHRLKHLVEEINLGALAGEMHADKLKPDKVEMRQYYEQHKEEYKDRPFDEVEREIEGKLIAQKQAEFIPKYIEELKANAVIDRNYDLLNVPAPTEAEVNAYYEAHSKEYVQAEFLRLQEMRISGADLKGGQERAEKALAKLRSGDEFGAVAGEFADDKKATTRLIERGQQAKDSEDRLFRFYPGELTGILNDGSSLVIGKVLEREGSKQKPLSQVRSSVKAVVSLEKQREKFKLNKYSPLFSVHGKQFTVEQFQEEFAELSPKQQEQFASFEAKKNLLDQLIVRELILEKTEDKTSDSRQRKEFDELKSRALRQMLHKEEVDEKLGVSEQEAREFYEKRKQALIEPAKAKISLIRANIGTGEDERSRARKKVEEAAERLKKGEDFAALAKQYSDDATTASRGGELDRWIYEGASQLGELYEHEFHDRVFKLQPGQASDIFEFAGGFWIVKMREQVASQQMTLEQARPLVERYLKAVKHQERTFEMQNELLEKSQLVIRDYVLSRKLQVESKKHKGEAELH